MADDYFEKFPVIVYSNTACLDISRRVKLSDKTRNAMSAFYPFEIESGMRSDILSYGYYQNPYPDWLIYLSNGIIDPYYGWYLSGEDFEAYIVKKYGSIEAALKRVKYYRLNWVEDDVEITPSYYDNHLPNALKKYYSPRFGVETRISSYMRRREEWVTNTNRITQLTVEDEGFEAGELCQIKSGPIQVGSAEIVSVSNTIVTIQHVSGNTSANNNLYGETSNTTSAITHSLTLVENITEDEYVYWTPVTVFDWEMDKNEKNKFIQLLDPSYSLTVSEELRLSLKDVSPT